MKRFLEAARERLGALVRRGPRHRERLSGVDTTIVVSGIRGKSSATKYLSEVLEKRGYDTLGKVTGNRPVCLRNGERHPIERDGSVTLYENERELRRHGEPDVLVFENQAISDYTNWVFNRYFANPDVVLLTNIRQDHRDTLGSDRLSIARSLARSIPEGTTVVNGEQNDTIRSCLESELKRRDCEIINANVPSADETIPGAEVVYGVDAVLEVIGEQPLNERLLRGYLEEMKVEWTTLPNGRVFNAASVNDVESTEAIRQSLQEQDAPVIQPIVYLRRDRRARTDAFLSYLGQLHDAGKITRARVVGENTGVFTRKADYPVIEHDPEEAASDVLGTALADEQPVVLMGNTVASFMREMEEVIDSRVSIANQSVEDETEVAMLPD